MATGYDLGFLVGNLWHQFATTAGQDYYVNSQTGQTQWTVPSGYEDHPQDTWDSDTSKGWQQWRNRRTGRITLINPRPPPPRNYLDLLNVKTHLSLVEQHPDSHEYLYRRVLAAILKSVFKEEEGFDVVQEEVRGAEGDRSKPDFVILKILARPGGSAYAYDWCFCESKMLGEPWGSTEDQLSIYCAKTDNATEKVYGMVHIGLHCQLYRAEGGHLTPLTGRLHLRDDVATVTQWLIWIKSNPLRVE